MNILVIVNSLEAGGAEKSAVRFAKAIKGDIASNVDFGTFRNSNKDLYQLPKDIRHFKKLSSYQKTDKIPVRIIRLLMKPIMAIKDLYKMRKLVLINNYDLVVSFGAEAGCMTFLALWFTGISQITSERIPPNPNIFKQTILPRILRPYIYKHSVICSVQSKKVEEWVSLKWKVKSYLTPNFFEMPEQCYTSFPANGPVISIGRPTHQKGYDVLLPAWAKYQLVSNRELWIVCDDPDNYIKNLATELKINHLQIIKPQTNINELFDKCSLYISTSRFEGYPNAITEALIYGLPVLTTVNSDVVADHISKDLCLEIKDNSPELLANSLDQILLDDLLLKSVSKKAILSQKNFSWVNARDYWKLAISAAQENI